MSLHGLAVAMLFFIALYPPVTAAFWIAGGLIFRVRDERTDIGSPPSGGWPPLTILVPAYNEEQVIAGCVRSVLAVDYPELEVLVLDDGSSDATAAAAEEACADDSRAEVVRDEVNRGKAERLNIGFQRASHELVIVCDADTHLHALAPKFLVVRMLRSPADRRGSRGAARDEPREPAVRDAGARGVLDHRPHPQDAGASRQGGNGCGRSRALQA